MKVRWKETSIRLRITPSELETLRRNEPVCASLAVPGGLSWRVALLTHETETCLTSADEEVRVWLGAADLARLCRPDAEGVYFKTDDASALRYFVEKDFPCAHPRLVDALEAASETFPPTAEFEARKKSS